MSTHPKGMADAPRPLAEHEQPDAGAYARERKRELRELDTDSGCYRRRKLPALDESERDE